MEKISGILPSSPRVASADVKSSAPIRPGTPDFGRPVGVSTSVQKEANAPISRLAMQSHRELMDLRSPEEKQVDIVKQMSDQFFMRKVRPMEDKMSEYEVQTVPPVLNDEIDSAEWDQPEVGRYLDVNA